MTALRTSFKCIHGTQREAENWKLHLFKTGKMEGIDKSEWPPLWNCVVNALYSGSELIYLRVYCFVANPCRCIKWIAASSVLCCWARSRLFENANIIIELELECTRWDTRRCDDDANTITKLLKHTQLNDVAKCIKFFSDHRYTILNRTLNIFTTFLIQ